MIQKLVDKFDWIVYRLSYRSINRMCKRHNGAYAILLKLSIDEWLEENPVTESVKSSAEQFHEAMRGHNYEMD